MRASDVGLGGGLESSVHNLHGASPGAGVSQLTKLQSGFRGFGVFFVWGWLVFPKKNRSQNKTELQNPKVAALTLFL